MAVSAGQSGVFGPLASVGSSIGAIAFFVFLVIVLFAVGDWVRKHYGRLRAWLDQRAEAKGTKSSSHRPRGTAQTEPVSAAARSAIDDAFQAGLKLSDLEWQSIDVVERDSRFQRHVVRMTRDDIPFEQLRQLAKADQVIVAGIALIAINRRADVPPAWTTEAISMLNNCSPLHEPYVYRSILDRPSYPVIGPALSKLDANVDWNELARFIEQRRERGEEVDLDTFRSLPIRFVSTLEMFVDRQESRLGYDFRDYFDEWRRTTVDVEFLGELGRLLERPYDQPAAYLGGRRQELVEMIVDALGQKPPRSLLLVGEHGVGKSMLARAALEQMPPDLVAFEARAAEINAGAVWVGELEGRIKELAAKLTGHNVVWLLPGFEETLFSGQHMRSPQGMLDALLPYIERGEITVIGEITSAAYENLLAERPRLASAFDVVRVRALDSVHAVAAAGHVLAGREMTASAETLEETYELAQQFLPGLAAPGNVLKLLAATADVLAEDGVSEVEATDVLAALAASTGLPLAMLDSNAPLDLREVRTFFERRVLAQPEAVEVIVERIALIKAALADPTRPLGVFLFVGPTGTGKTEIAKALAEFLFGSQRRLVRLDMSEYQTPDALERLLSDPNVEPRGSALLSSVRREPFAVVLLDEFEKAAQPVWDIFLQLFDDGRLTDQQGRTADFRRCVIVLTSNLGSALAHRPAPGFGAAHGSFREELIERELNRTFRIEFLNRIDRVVIFQPFERAEMRALLDKELAEALARRGLRTRPWAIELDESAVEFLIEQGFSPELGARPLKRALERHLLTRIAAAIVEQKAPEGDQFLLVSAAAGRLDVRFVDPDAPADESERDADAETTASLDLRALALRSRGDSLAVRFLLDELARTRSLIDEEMLPRKQTALDAMSEPGFWEDDDRYAILAQAEYLDRLDAALHTATKLGQRLDRGANGRGIGELEQLLALRLHVLQAAAAGVGDDQPYEVFLRVHPASTDDSEAGARWTAQLAEMYEAWAERRGMRAQRLDENEHLYAVGGLGAGALLCCEAGLHLLELAPDNREGSRIERLHALVEVAAREPGPDEERPLAQQAQAAFERVSQRATVVRRYRAEPSPLVRDAVRGYRTGRLERVLAGDFDLF